MDLLWLLLRVALAVMFLVAAATKAFSIAGTRESLRGFGVPDPVVPAGALALPALEVVLAAGLIAQPTATAAAWASVAVLLAFSAAFARVLRRGDEVSCNCFGSTSAEPVGAGSLVRNAVLAVIALAVALFGPGESIGDALSGASAGAIVAIAALIVVLAGLATLSWQLLRQNGRLLERVSALETAVTGLRDGAAPVVRATTPPGGLPIGAPAPSFEHDGRQLPAPGESFVLAFTDAHCAACHAVGHLIVDARAHGARVVQLQNRELAIEYRAHGVPAAVLVDDDGLIASEVVHGSDDIGRLLTSVTSPPVLRVEQQ